MIHIACNIDANFMQHCAVTLVSLFENNKSADICVHIVAPSLSEENQQILRNLVASYGNDIRFYFPPEDLLSCFAIKKFGKRISMATYYRCMFSAILPDDVEKVLYLDCDIVVLGDISDFGIQICPAVVQLVLKILVRTKTNVMNGFITTDRILILMPVCSLST